MPKNFPGLSDDWLNTCRLFAVLTCTSLLIFPVTFLIGLCAIDGSGHALCTSNSALCPRPLQSSERQPFHQAGTGVLSPCPVHHGSFWPWLCWAPVLSPPPLLAYVSILFFKATTSDYEIISPFCRKCKSTEKYKEGKKSLKNPILGHGHPVTCWGVCCLSFF